MEVDVSVDESSTCSLSLFLETSTRIALEGLRSPMHLRIKRTVCLEQQCIVRISVESLCFHFHLSCSPVCPSCLSALIPIEALSHSDIWYWQHLQKKKNRAKYNLYVLEPFSFNSGRRFGQNKSFIKCVVCDENQRGVVEWMRWWSFPSALPSEKPESRASSWPLAGLWRGIKRFDLTDQLNDAMSGKAVNMIWLIWRLTDSLSKWVISTMKWGQFCKALVIVQMQWSVHNLQLLMHFTISVSSVVE